MKTMLLLSALAVFAAVPARADDYGKNASDRKMENPSDRSDTWITAKVKSSLLYHASVSGIKTEVETRGGVVTLRGEAENQAQKELAAEYANGIEGVRRVDNQMTVKGESASRFDDATITAQVKSALLSRRSTSAFQTGVKTRNGVVTLTGSAKNPAEKELAERLARGVSGVKSVENRMDVENR